MTAAPAPGQLSAAKRALLARRLRPVNAPAPGIPRLPAGAPVPPSPAQERMWFLEQFTPGTATYLIPFGIRLRGPLDTDALAMAVQRLADRHDALRTGFTTTPDGQPRVSVAEAVRVPWRVVDADGPAEAHELLAEAGREPFDLSVPPLLRVTLVRLGERDHILHLVVHHIVADGWSSGIMMDDLAAGYAAAVAGRPPAPAPPVRYADFAAWQRDRLRGEVAERDLAYWRTALAGTPPLDLPTDRPRPAEQGYAGSGHRLWLDAELTAGLRRLGQVHGATLYMTLLAGVTALLARVSGAEDFAVGMPVAGRVRPELEPLVGLFTNTLAVRADVGGDPSFTTLLERTRERVVEALAHQEMPFERLVQELGVVRDVSRSPVFQVMVVLQNYAASTGNWPGFAVEWFAVRADTSRFDLTVYLEEHPDGVAGWLGYRTDLFDADTIARLADQLGTLLAGAVADPGAALSGIDLLDETGRRRVLELAVDDRASEPRGVTGAAVTLADVIAPHVAATPDAPAVVCGSRTLSYRDLDRRGRRLAARLRALGVGPDTVVGIVLEHSVEVAVAMLGVLRAGGAYLPLDPEQPPARLAAMLADAAPVAVLATGDRLRRPPPGIPVELLVDVDGPARRTREPGGAGSDGAGPDSAGPDDLAYVIFTSGSTGRPKGVAVAHRQVLRYLDGVGARFGVVPGARYALPQSLAYDFSVTVFYLALATGGAVHLVPRRGTGAELADHLRRHRIDYLKITPSHLAALAAEVGADELIPARALILGGEACSAGWAAELAGHAARRGAAVVNHYGPTEATVGITTRTVTPRPDGAADTGGSGAIPIGRPLPHARVYVLDSRGRPTPIGVPGEIVLGGDRLARGYLGQPGATAARFVPDPFGPPGARMYRTGDLGRWDSAGDLHFLGRIDRQLKVRGYRVEPAEIEAALAGHPAVARAVVVMIADRLVGYLERVPASPAVDPTQDELRRYLLERLPEPMVPTQYVLVDRLPMQEHGKVDHRALPAPPPVEAGAGVAPVGPVETAIARVWSDLLGVGDVGATDDFFALGGHSLLAIRVVARLARELPEDTRPVGVVDLFRYRTVRDLAGYAAGSEPGGDRLLHELTRPVPTAERVASLVCVPYGGASAVVYQPLADALPAGYALHAVAVPGHDIGTAGAHATIDEVAAGCTEEILARIAGPLLVYGHCGPGGALAVEIVRRLEAAGRRVEALYLGGIFPFARPRGGLLGPLLRLRLAERLRGDRVHANWLRGMGADLDELDDDQITFLVRAMRKDAVAAEEYFTDLLHRGVTPLRTPVVSVVGDRDPGVEYYQERYREWHFLTGLTALVVLDEGGHYFVKFRAAELAEIVCTVHRRLGGQDGGQDVPVGRARADEPDEPDVPVGRARADEPTAGPEPGWRLAAVSRSAAGSTTGDGAPPRATGSPAPPPAGPRPSMRRFLAIAAGQLVSMTGTAFTEFAIPLHIYLTTGSLVRFALFAVLGLVPGMLVAPVAGAVVDRADRRRVMLAADLAAGTLALALGTLLWTDHLEIWHLYGFVAALSVALTFQRLAYNAAIPQLVPKHFLGHANGVLQIAAGTAQFLVPLLAVGLMALIGLGGILAIDVASYVVAVAVVVCLRFPATMGHRRRETLLAEVAGGIRYSVGRREFRAMLIFFAVLNLFLAPAFLLVSPLVLGLATVQEVGRVALAGGAGGIAGGVVMLVWGGPRRARMRGVLVASLVLAGFAVVTGSRPSLNVIGVGVFGMSLALSVLNGVYATIIQTKVPQRLQGRVIALNTVAAWSTLPVGWAVIAPLATGVAEPLLQPGGALAPTVGAVIGVGPGRGIALAYLLFAVGMAVVVAVARRTRVLARFDRDVPDAPPDDVVGLERRAARLAAAGAHPSVPEG